MLIHQKKHLLGPRQLFSDISVVFFSPNCECWHYQYLIVLLWFCAILGILETQEVSDCCAEKKSSWRSDKTAVDEPHLTSFTSCCLPRQADVMSASCLWLCYDRFNWGLSSHNIGVNIRLAESVNKRKWPYCMFQHKVRHCWVLCWELFGYLCLLSQRFHKKLQWFFKWNPSSLWHGWHSTKLTYSFSGQS